ncbi:MAG: adenylate/guanylate cyclase domain-containing protein [Proteobacteria bacterium]|nr:adenylate/guanylate cyclase domain-containing protein [Pseudomonadota bacterium]
MTKEGVKRKLTAIFSADVKEYSRLMTQDEVGTIRTLTAYKEAMSSLIQQYRGRVVDAPGDNLMAEFASVVDAVSCAVEIQRELAERNSELPYDRQMEFRIGINLGDVVEEEDRIYGDGVNIAARVESLAEGGGICISGKVYEEVKGKLGLEYEYLGEQAVKNIQEPVRVYRVLSFPGAAAHRVVQAKRAVALEQITGIQLPDRPSIAVLPFDNMSGDPEQQYFADGLTEDIITSLSYIRNLMVIARKSSSIYKDKSVDVRQIGRELGVRYVLEGSVRKAGERMRITAQLIDATNGDHLWAESWDRPLQDFFALQDEITQKVMEELDVKLVYGEQARRSAGTTNNLKAYRLFHQGREKVVTRFTREDLFQGRELIEKALEEDPKFIRGWVALAWTYRHEFFFKWSDTPEIAWDKGLEAAERALAMDDTLSDSYAVLAILYNDKGDTDSSVPLIKKAIELDPNNAQNYALAGLIFNDVGMPEEGLVATKKAFRLNPFPEPWYFWPLSASYNHMAQYDNAIVAAKECVNRLKENIDCRFHLTIAYMGAGQEAEARKHAKEMLRIDPHSSYIKWYLTTQKNPEVKQRLEDLLRKVGLLK